MHSILDTAAIATAEMYSHQEYHVKAIATERKTVRTPQRRANYNDKTRFRRVDLKQIAFKKYSCSSNAQIKNYLKVLGFKLDLRLTAAWVAIVYELGQEIFAAKAILEAISPQPQPEDGVQFLLAAMKEAIASENWKLVKVRLATHANYKTQAWAMLTCKEREQLTALVPEAVRLLTSDRLSVISKERLIVTLLSSPSTY